MIGIYHFRPVYQLYNGSYIKENLLKQKILNDIKVAIDPCPTACPVLFFARVYMKWDLTMT